MNKTTLFLIAFTLTSSGLSIAADTPAKPATLATINGVPITEPEVNYFMSKLKNPVPAERVIQEMINVELLVQAAKNEGMMKDESLMLDIKRSTSSLIASHFLQKQLVNMDITPEVLKARYQKDYVGENKAKEFNASHILVKTQDEAKDIINQLDNGAVFIELAKKLSTGPSGVKGGALDWFKPTDMVAPFSLAASLLQPKQYTKKPVETQFGWHIILLNDSRSVEPPTFESVSKKLSSVIASEEVSKVMKKLHDTAKIVFTDK